MYFRAMVLEDSQHWYADDGKLSKTFCEQTENDIKYDPEECCACDEAKYKVIQYLPFNIKTFKKTITPKRFVLIKCNCKLKSVNVYGMCSI